MNVKNYCHVAIVKAVTFCLALMASLPTVAQTSPSSTLAIETQPPPVALVAEAQRFAQVAGQTLNGSPQEWSDSTDQQTGHTIWQMRWLPDPNSSNGIEVKVDAATMKAVDYDNDMVRAGCVCKVVG